MKKQNTFKLNDFDKFVVLDESVKMKANFEDDEKIYRTFSDQMNQKFKDEVVTADFKN